MTDPVVGHTPEWLPFEFDPAGDRVALLRMSEEDYRRASFLDQRILSPSSHIRQVPWSALASAMPPDARRDAQYIFHIGNVGSTLISRLLGEMETVFALREPLLLRSFADQLGPAGQAKWSEEESQGRLDTLTALLSRTFAADQRSLIKATSFTSEIAWRLVPAGSQALFLYANPQHYLENMLAGDNSRQTLAILADSRARRLQSRCEGLDLDPSRMSAGRKAAMTWACEMTALEQSEERMPGATVAWVDFDRFLAAPADGLTAIGAHFNLNLDSERARALAGGPLMRRYSKALEYEYSPDLRRQILEDARWRFRSEIEDALAWLQTLATRHPLIAKAVRRVRS